MVSIWHELGRDACRCFYLFKNMLFMKVFSKWGFMCKKSGAEKEREEDGAESEICEHGVLLVQARRRGAKGPPRRRRRRPPRGLVGSPLPAREEARQGRPPKVEEWHRLRPVARLAPLPGVPLLLRPQAAGPCR